MYPFNSRDLVLNWPNQVYIQPCLCYDRVVILLCCRLLELFPELAHVEDETLVYPHWTQLDMMFGKTTYDWSKQYSCHVWRRMAANRVPESPNDIARLTSTVAQMMRYIYNGPR